MMKLMVKLLALVVVALLAYILVRDDPGFVMVKYGELIAETTLAFALFVVFVLMVLFYYLIRFLRGLLFLPKTLHDKSVDRRFSKTRRLLNQGLIDLSEGRFAQAEKNLLKLVNNSESPLLHYLAAARAAQLQGKHAERDSYLAAAHDSNPDAEVAIGVTQAELQLAHAQTEQALATLSHIHSIAPRHNYVSMLLARAYFEAADWQQLVELLPDVRKTGLIRESRLLEMERAGYSGLCRHAADRGGEQALNQCWSKVPKNLKTDPEILAAYIERLNQSQWRANDVDDLVKSVLNRKWDNRLIVLFGEYNHADANAQLATMEKWLKDLSNNEYLLMALGLTAMRAQLWGKAQGYFESSIAAGATPRACLELARLLEGQLQQPEQAAAYFKQGLTLEARNASSAV